MTKKFKYKDPCIMTHEEALADYDYWQSLAASGKSTAHNRDVEGHLQMLHDRLEILNWEVTHDDRYLRVN